MSLDYGTGRVVILPDLTKFGPELEAGVAKAGVAADASLGKSLSSVDQRVAQSSKGFSAWGSGIKTAASFAGVAIGAEIIKGGIDAAEGIEKSSSRMQAALDGIKQPQAMDAIQAWAKGFSDETGILRGDILDMASKLATMGSGFFKAVGPDAGKWIETITADMEDLAAATGKSSAMLMRSLGPAILNTPEKAIPLLQKYGALTDDQAAKVKALAEAGDNAAASEQLLLDIQSKFGGSAAKTATASDHLKVSMNETGIVIGEVLMPVISGAANVLSDLSPVLEFAGKNAGVLLSAFLGYKAVMFLPGLLQSVGLAAGTIGLDAVAVGATKASGALAGLSAPEIAIGVLSVANAVQTLQVALKFGDQSDLQKVVTGLDSGTISAGDLAVALLKAKETYGSALEGISSKTTGLDDILTAAGVDVGRFGTNSKAAYDLLSKALEQYRARTLHAADATNTHSADMRAGSGAANDLLAVTGPLAAAVAGEGAAAKAAAWNEQHLAQMHHAVAQAAHAQWTAELELAGGLVGVETAAAQARDGQKKLQDLAAAGKTGTKAYSQALADEQSNVLALAGAVQTYEDQQKQSPAAAAAALGALEALGSKYGLTKDQIDRMAASGQHAIGVIDGVAAHVNALHDKTITITVQQRGDTSLHGGGGLAAGGPVDPWVPYMVGERGPELFVSDRPGYVVPNQAITSGHSGGIPAGTSVRLEGPIEIRGRLEFDPESAEVFIRGVATDVVRAEAVYRGL